jgi:protein-arginine kinase activator protein McsA
MGEKSNTAGFFKFEISEALNEFKLYAVAHSPSLKQYRNILEVLVESEEYEAAAIVRDKIKELENPTKK